MTRAQRRAPGSACHRAAPRRPPRPTVRRRPGPGRSGAARACRWPAPRGRRHPPRGAGRSQRAGRRSTRPARRPRSRRPARCSSRSARRRRGDVPGVPQRAAVLRGRLPVRAHRGRRGAAASVAYRERRRAVAGQLGVVGEPGRIDLRRARGEAVEDQPVELGPARAGGSSSSTASRAISWRNANVAVPVDDASRPRAPRRRASAQPAHTRLEQPGLGAAAASTATTSSTVASAGDRAGQRARARRRGRSRGTTSPPAASASVT